MAQILIRNINEDIKDRLRKRAIKHGTSMEAEVRSILANSTVVSSEVVIPPTQHASVHI